ncbi:MAG TPA: hypothetical protein VHQ47_07165 [Phycisphaerae bacterium]|nr:hypothetical protein [Phycisphaerae bacterium]
MAILPAGSFRRWVPLLAAACLGCMPVAAEATLVSVGESTSALSINSDAPNNSTLTFTDFASDRVGETVIDYAGIGSTVTRNPDGSLTFTYRFVADTRTPPSGFTLVSAPIGPDATLSLPVASDGDVDVSLLTLPGSDARAEAAVVSRSGSALEVTGIADAAGNADLAFGFALRTSSAAGFTRGGLVLEVPGDEFSPHRITAYVPVFGSSSGVPEPASVALVLAAVIPLGARLRRVLL